MNTANPTLVIPAMRPAGALGAFVEKMWWGLPYPERERAFVIEPDGRVDVVLAFNASGGSAVAFGSTTRATQYLLDPSLHYLGIRFRPGRALPFLNLSAGELRDAHHIADRVGSVTAESLIGAAIDNIKRPSFDPVARQLETFARAQNLRPTLMEALTQYIEQRAGMVTVEDLAYQAGLGARQLERLFHAHIGMSPKLFARIARYNRVRDALSAGARLNADLAARFGYTDESHLRRDYHAFALATPD